MRNGKPIVRDVFHNRWIIECMIIICGGINQIYSICEQIMYYTRFTRRTFCARFQIRANTQITRRWRWAMFRRQPLFFLAWLCHRLACVVCLADNSARPAIMLACFTRERKRKGRKHTQRGTRGWCACIYVCLLNTARAPLCVLCVIMTNTRAVVACRGVERVCVCC